MAAGPTGDVYNVGGGEAITALDALRLIESITGRKANVTYGPPRPGEQQTAIADTRKARERFNWRPTMGIEEGLRRQVAWHRELRATGAAT